MYERILRAGTNISPRYKKQLEKKIMSLRPSIKSIKHMYRQKGESEDNIKLIVTPKNYPNLKQVCISKRQQKVLLDILNGTYV